MFRVHTDFLFQNSKIFFQPFFQNNNFFFQTRWSIGTFKNAGIKLLSSYSWDWIRFDQNKTKNHTYKFVVALKKKKTQDFLPFFQTLFPFSRLFPGLENCWANFKTFSRIQDSVRTLFILFPPAEPSTNLIYRNKWSILCVILTGILCR